MAADVVLVLRANHDRAASERARAKAEIELERVRQAAEEIRRMTRLYQERLEGRRRAQ